MSTFDRAEVRWLKHLWFNAVIEDQCDLKKVGRSQKVGVTMRTPCGATNLIYMNRLVSSLKIANSDVKSTEKKKLENSWK